MEQENSIDTILAAVHKERLQGRNTIDAVALEEYLIALKQQCEENGNNATLSPSLDVILARFAAQNNARLEHYKTVNASGDVALKSAILINGGAAVALLAFLGNISKEDALSRAVTQQIPLPMLCFSVGVLFAAIATGMKYLAMRNAGDGESCRFKVYNNISISLVALSYAGFLFGGVLACRAFLKPLAETHFPLDGPSLLPMLRDEVVALASPVVTEVLGTPDIPISELSNSRHSINPLYPDFCLTSLIGYDRL